MDIKKVKDYPITAMSERGRASVMIIKSISCGRVDSPFHGKMLIDKKIWTCEWRQLGNEGSIKRGDEVGLGGGWGGGEKKKSKYLQLSINHGT